ncbi:response regulator [Fusibacter sp. JL216-2]|uniref:response regulator n=1 Tax=Fusibacter sp. JL216-2 TaxID=3071453 RepID=UPI003D348601
MFGTFDETVLRHKENSEFEILIVDDNSKNLKVLSSILIKKEYKIRTAQNGLMALNSLKKRPVDLILLDINMPVMDGFELCQKLKSIEAFSEIPIIFITALSSLDDKMKGFEMGAVDFITKPFMIEEVQARVKAHLKLIESRELLEVKNKELQKIVNKKVKLLASSHIATVFAMVQLAEARDDDTGKHIARISRYCKRLAELAYESNNFPEIDLEFIDNIEIASPLHDIGKIGIRDVILLKPGKLIESEFDIMKTHVNIGARNLQIVADSTPENGFIQMGILIAKYHHEKWDGTGYTQELKGNEIPVCARIMTIADVYDALRSKRVYKKAFSHEKSMEIMDDMCGVNFDPKLYEIFYNHQSWFENTYNKLSGGGDE